MCGVGGNDGVEHGGAGDLGPPRGETHRGFKQCGAGKIADQCFATALLRVESHGLGLGQIAHGAFGGHSDGGDAPAYVEQQGLVGQRDVFMPHEPVDETGQAYGGRHAVGEVSLMECLGEISSHSNFIP